MFAYIFQGKWLTKEDKMIIEKLEREAFIETLRNNSIIKLEIDKLDKW